MGVKVLRNMLTAQRAHKKRGSGVRTCLQTDESRGGIGVIHDGALHAVISAFLDRLHKANNGRNPVDRAGFNAVPFCGKRKRVTKPKCSRIHYSNDDAVKDGCRRDADVCGAVWTWMTDVEEPQQQKTPLDALISAVYSPPQ